MHIILSTIDVRDHHRYLSMRANVKYPVGKNMCFVFYQSHQNAHYGFFSCIIDSVFLNRN